MTGCRVSMDELVEDRRQTHIDNRVKALKSELNAVIDDKLRAELESHSRDEFLGFGKFTPLFEDYAGMPQQQFFRNKTFVLALEQIWVDTVMLGDFETAAAVVATRVEMGEMDDRLAEAVRGAYIPDVAEIIEERVEELRKIIHEDVYENWSSYE